MSTYYTENGHLVSDETVPTLQSELRRLGQGVSRTAYALNDHEVLKVDYNAGWAGSNRTECAFWDALDESDKEHFAAIIARADDYSWIVCERIETVGTDAYGTNADILREWVNNDLRDLQCRYEFSDMHEGNYGIRTNGTCAVLDYAMNPNRNNAVNSDIEDESCECDDCLDARQGPYCDECNSRHHAGATTQHGQECAHCNERTNRTLQDVLFKTDHHFRNGAKVSKWTQRAVCAYCNKTDNRYIVRERFGKAVKVITDIPVIANDPNQIRLFFTNGPFVRSPVEGCRCGCNEQGRQFVLNV